ncbi:uncharacterized protein LOC109603451 [Aethina tumida]|uniref:uncharacterized protein LOC109603451 n=1 Tax=Aethina tumida TaxID=116153 RepID=UPI00214919E9|nr:uncharacterized protein LOC109603451 [Aethina tumida]XP_049821433.1 uncharacterized protein LOC109603451 [Aethina tumida]
MRRSSNAVLQTQTSEPLIVVEDQENEDNPTGDDSSQPSSEDESPTMNPYLLCPYGREVRKLSLPSPQCSGITASQVRRLSERGETIGPGPRQAEFLATLSTAQQPTPGGRRHSVVTISKVPSAMFGRNRRESVAAFPTSAFQGRVLPNRRESIACPPSTEPRGSIHNLQLDIMDDIVQARKVRMKLWNTSSEKVCEVQPLDEAGTVQRYTNSGRRFSDFVGTTLAPIPSSNKRRASELPATAAATAQTAASTSASKKPTTGIVCSNTDLISILSSLSTSASDLNQCERDREKERTVDGPAKNIPTSLQQKRSRLKSNRSSSFDISILQSVCPANEPNDPKSTQSPSNWFANRHQPKPETVAATKDKQKAVVDSEPGKVVWDERSGSLVDAHALGSAIEVFLRKSSPDKTKTKTGSKSKTAWFSKPDDDSTETCDSSLCSTLKDLFVK